MAGVAGHDCRYLSGETAGGVRRPLGVCFRSVCGIAGCDLIQVPMVDTVRVTKGFESLPIVSVGEG
jgi:hypothetical protein